MKPSDVDPQPATPRTSKPVRPTLVVYLPGMTPSANASDAALAEALAQVDGWAEFTKTHGGTAGLAPRLAFRDWEGLDALIKKANANAEKSGVRGYRPLDYQRYLLISIPADSGKPMVDTYCGLKADLQRIGGRVYLSLPARPAQASDGYMGPAAVAGGIGGIGAQGLSSAHSGKPINGDGQWIVDVEKAWLGAGALMATLPTSLAVVESGELADIHHGTAVAGIILGAGGTQPVAGIAPNARFFKAPCLELTGLADPSETLAGTILTAGVQLSRAPTGTGVLLIQQETWDALPLESSPLEFAAIQTVAAAGHVVVQPAGNAGLNLDTVSGFWIDPLGNVVERALNPQAVATSGAIVVAAGCSGHQPAVGGFRQRHPASNHGALADCWAWGDSIATLGATRDAAGNLVAFADPAGFGGTSGAAAIIAGAIVLLQQMRAEAIPAQPPLTAMELKGLLRTPMPGSEGSGGLEGRYQPDLATLKQQLGL